MSRCAGRKRDGRPCAVTVNPPQTYCWWHDPERADQRRQNASMAAKAKALGGEIPAIRREVRGVVAGVLNGEIPREIAAVALQGYNVLLRACEQERRQRETDELAARIEALESEEVGNPWP